MFNYDEKENPTNSTNENFEICLKYNMQCAFAQVYGSFTDYHQIIQ